MPTVKLIGVLLILEVIGLVLNGVREFSQVYWRGLELGSRHYEAAEVAVYALFIPSGILTLMVSARIALVDVIRAERHVHMSKDDMTYYGVADGDYMKLKIDGPCGVTFDRVKVRFHPKVVLEVHIDTDEGNACDLDSATHMELFK